MNTFIRLWADVVINYRYWICGLAIVLFGGALYAGRDIPFDNSSESFFVEGDPNLHAFDRLLDLFGDPEYLIIGIEAREQDTDVLEPQTLHMIADLSEFLEEHDNVTQVRSLTRYQYTHADADSLSTDDLIPDIDTLENDAAARYQIKEILAAEPLALGNLITNDFRHTRIAARVAYKRKTAEHKTALVKDVYHFVEQQGYAAQGYELRYSGQPLINARFEMHTREDSKILNPAMAVLMLVVLFFSFRAVGAVLTPWLVIGMGIAYVLGVQGLLGFPHSPVDSALVPTMIIVGIGVSVHVLVEFYHHRRDGAPPKQAAREAIILLWKPAFFTAFTTSIGFCALAVTKIVPVREFAWLGAVGPLLLFVLAVSVLPAVLSFISAYSPKTAQVVESGLISRMTAAIPNLVRRHRNPILLLSFTLVAVAIITVPTLSVDTNFIDYFKANNPARRDMVYFDHTYKGVMPLEVILDSGSEGGIKQPQFLRQVEKFQTFLQANPTLGHINSLVDYLKQINRSLHGDDPAFYTLPDSPEAVAQYLFLYENSGPNEDLSDIKDFDNRYVRLTVPIINLPASAMAVELDKIQAELDKNYPDLNAVTTGGMRMFHEQNIYSAQGMFRSFGIALLLISICFIFIFRSVKYGLLSIIPSVLPILLVGGVVGLVGIHLDLGTMIVGAMTMGIAVDDAIHVMSRYLLAKKQGHSTHEAIQRAMNESGRAVVFSSIVLVLGFSVLCFANLVTIMLVGVLGALIMLLALIGDLIFLPAILYWADDDRKESKRADVSQKNTEVAQEVSLES